MGIDYIYVNFTRRERFSVDALGGGGRIGALGRTLASRALHLMILGAPGDRRPGERRTIGRWTGESIGIIGDTMAEWESFAAEHTDVAANAIMAVYQQDGFDEIGEAAEEGSALFMQLCYLISTRQAPELEPHMVRKFGAKYLARFAMQAREYPWFTYADLAPAPDR